MLSIAQLIAGLAMSNSFHRAYLGKRLQDLLDLTHVQMKLVYESHGLIIPVEGSSTLQALRPGSRQALADLARTLNQPHQLVAQRLEKLVRLGLAERSPDRNDKRRFEFALTQAGTEQWHLLDRIMRNAIDVNKGLFEEINIDLIEALDNAISHLNERGLQDRFKK